MDLRDPAVVSFFHDHGIDVRERPYWAPVFWEGVSVTVLDRDPLRLGIDIGVGGERLRQTVDRELSPVAIQRSRFE